MTEWKEAARQKRASQFESIPREWRLKDIPSGLVNSYEYIRTASLLTDVELSITEETDADVLLKNIASRKLSSVQVVQAFSKRAAIAQQLIGCCTEMFFDDALKRAKDLDEYLEKNGKVMGPLHGLPVSIKDSYSVKGQDTTVGWVGKIGIKAESNSPLVEILIGLGAVPYVKSNVPQSLMMSDSYNHVFKQSWNAFNRKLISGGSSGGEGALVGARASIVGIGTDIGGSIRIPANLQGLYGLCPSVGRVAYDDQGLRHFIVPPVAGPIASSLNTIDNFMSGLLSGQGWTVDPMLVPIPWRHELTMPPKRPLRIGYYVDDGMVKVQPPMERAVHVVVDKLKAAGHEVFEWDISSHKEAYRLWLRAILADGGRKCEALCKLANEPLIEGMLVGTAADRLTIDEDQALHGEKQEYQKAYLKRWKESNVDALITPVQPYAGFKPKDWVASTQYCGYTAHWNFVDYAAITVPVTHVNPVLDAPTEAWKSHVPRNGSDRFNQAQYDTELVKGMPVCAQIVGGRFGEENCIAVARVVEGLLKA